VALTIVPDEFTLVLYGADDVRAVFDEVAGLLGLPADVAVSLEVDEELAQPLTGSYVDVRDGVVHLWYSGGNVEDTRRPRHLDPVRARREFAMGILRGLDRRDDAFRDAPADDELTDAQRALWDVAAEGRAERAGIAMRPDRARYVYRLACGFTDEADAAYDRLRGGAPTSWADIAATAARLAPNAPKPRAGRRDDLRRRRGEG
jgi:hypothetical protein